MRHSLEIGRDIRPSHEIGTKNGDHIPLNVMASAAIHRSGHATLPKRIQGHDDSRYDFDATVSEIIQDYDAKEESMLDLSMLASYFESPDPSFIESFVGNLNALLLNRDRVFTSPSAGIDVSGQYRGSNPDVLTVYDEFRNAKLQETQSLDDKVTGGLKGPIKGVSSESVNSQPHNLAENMSTSLQQGTSLVEPTKEPLPTTISSTPNRAVHLHSVEGSAAGQANEYIAVSNATNHDGRVMHSHLNRQESGRITSPSIDQLPPTIVAEAEQWRWSKSPEGRKYFYHREQRNPVWKLPPHLRIAEHLVREGGKSRGQNIHVDATHTTGGDATHLPNKVPFISNVASTNTPQLLLGQHIELAEGKEGNESDSDSVVEREGKSDHAEVDTQYTKEGKNIDILPENQSRIGSLVRSNAASTSLNTVKYPRSVSPYRTTSRATADVTSTPNRDGSPRQLVSPSRRCMYCGQMGESDWLAFHVVNCLLSRQGGSLSGSVSMKARQLLADSQFADGKKEEGHIANSDPISLNAPEPVLLSDGSTTQHALPRRRRTSIGSVSTAPFLLAKQKVSPTNDHQKRHDTNSDYSFPSFAGTGLISPAGYSQQTSTTNTQQPLPQSETSAMRSTQTSNTESSYSGLDANSSTVQDHGHSRKLEKASILLQNKLHESEGTKQYLQSLLQQQRYERRQLSLSKLSQDPTHPLHTLVPTLSAHSTPARMPTRRSHVDQDGSNVHPVSEVDDAPPSKIDAVTKGQVIESAQMLGLLSHIPEHSQGSCEPSMVYPVDGRVFPEFIDIQSNPSPGPFPDAESMDYHDTNASDTQNRDPLARRFSHAGDENSLDDHSQLHDDSFASSSDLEHNNTQQQSPIGTQKGYHPRKPGSGNEYAEVNEMVDREEETLEAYNRYVQRGYAYDPHATDNSVQNGEYTQPESIDMRVEANGGHHVGSSISLDMGYHDDPYMEEGYKHRNNFASGGQDRNQYGEHPQYDFHAQQNDERAVVNVHHEGPVESATWDESNASQDLNNKWHSSPQPGIDPIDHRLPDTQTPNVHGKHLSRALQQQDKHERSPFADGLDLEYMDKLGVLTPEAKLYSSSNYHIRTSTNFAPSPLTARDLLPAYDHLPANPAAQNDISSDGHAPSSRYAYGSDMSGMDPSYRGTTQRRYSSEYPNGAAQAHTDSARQRQELWYGSPEARYTTSFRSPGHYSPSQDPPSTAAVDTSFQLEPPTPGGYSYPRASPGTGPASLSRHNATRRTAGGYLGSPPPPVPPLSSPGQSVARNLYQKLQAIPHDEIPVGTGHRHTSDAQTSYQNSYSIINSPLQHPTPFSPDNRLLPVPPSASVPPKIESNAAFSAEPADAEMERVPCPDCNRLFAPDRLEVHARVCKYVFGQASKRVPFSTADARLKNTPAESLTFASKRVPPCEFCGKRFSLLSDANLHALTCPFKREKARSPSSSEKERNFAPGEPRTPGRTDARNSRREGGAKEAPWTPSRGVSASNTHTPSSSGRRRLTLSPRARKSFPPQVDRHNQGLTEHADVPADVHRSALNEERNQIQSPEDNRWRSRDDMSSGYEVNVPAKFGASPMHKITPASAAASTPATALALLKKKLHTPNSSKRRTPLTVPKASVERLSYPSPPQYNSSTRQPPHSPSIPHTTCVVSKRGLPHAIQQEHLSTTSLPTAASTAVSDSSKPQSSRLKAPQTGRFAKPNVVPAAGINARTGGASVAASLIPLYKEFPAAQVKGPSKPITLTSKTSTSAGPGQFARDVDRIDPILSDMVPAPHRENKSVMLKNDVATLHLSTPPTSAWASDIAKEAQHPCLSCGAVQPSASALVSHILTCPSWKSQTPRTEPQSQSPSHSDADVSALSASLQAGIRSQAQLYS